jgi:hypothetical protein
MESGTRLSITVELEDKVSQVLLYILRRYSTEWKYHASESTSAHNYSKGKSSPTSIVMQSDRGTWHKNEAHSNTHTETLADEHLA